MVEPTGGVRGIAQRMGGDELERLVQKESSENPVIHRLQTRLSEVQEKLDDANRRAEAAERLVEKVKNAHGYLYYRGSALKLVHDLSARDAKALEFEVEVYRQ